MSHQKSDLRAPSATGLSSVEATEPAASETKRLARAAREARILSQMEACRILEKNAFRLAEIAREANLSFMVYLFEMARVAAVDERARLGRIPS